MSPTCSWTLATSSPVIDFTAAIADAVESCDVMLALIGSRRVTAVTPEGRRRLEDADDDVAGEIGRLWSVTFG